MSIGAIILTARLQVSFTLATQYRKEVATWAAHVTRTRYPDQCFDGLAKAKNRLYWEDRCDMASSVKYPKRVGAKLSRRRLRPCKLCVYLSLEKFIRAFEESKKRAVHFLTLC